MKRPIYLALLGIVMIFSQCSNKENLPIYISGNASELEKLAASEVRRYVYLRTDELLTIVEGDQNSSKGIRLQVDEQLDEQESVCWALETFWK